jgi:hypothetical protein
MDNIAWSDLTYRRQNLRSNRTIERNLILLYLHNQKTQSELGYVLLKFELAVESQEHIKRVLRHQQKWSIFQAAPAAFMHIRHFMGVKELFDPRIYAFVNEDAHSTIWLLASSRTVKTCSRVTDG